jgi:GDPmannose 4,6-dehydratase
LDKSPSRRAGELKKALITGVTGQDGSYLAEFLLEKNYEVHASVRRSSSFNRGRIEHLLKGYGLPLKKLNLHYGDMTDTPSLNKILSQVMPDEVYNLAAQSHVAVSFETPEYTGQADAIGPLRILDCIKSLGLTNTCRFYQASTSELFGKVVETPQTELTPFHPRSPYAIAKLYAHWITLNYREAFNMYTCSGIMFNHESPRRGENFVTRKITLSLAKIFSGSNEQLQLGNLNAKRDWGYAKDYVEGMWLTLQQDKPDDYVFATGKQYNIRDFVEEAFRLCGINIIWEGSGIDEKGVDKTSGRVYITVNPLYFRPTDVESLLGDSSKAKEKLGWVHKTSLKELTRIMVEADLRLAGLNPASIMTS